jgi:hypothetical protein
MHAPLTDEKEEHERAGKRTDIKRTDITATTKAIRCESPKQESQKHYQY